MSPTGESVLGETHRRSAWEVGPNLESDIGQPMLLNNEIVEFEVREWMQLRIGRANRNLTESVN